MRHEENEENIAHSISIFFVLGIDIGLKIQESDYYAHRIHQKPSLPLDNVASRNHLQ